MAGGEILGAAGSGAGRIGRYFTVVSALPAAVFVSYVFLLARTGAWSGPIRWSAFTDVDLAEVAVLGIASFVVALALNPLQFVLIQLFEGYWGPSAPARHLATSRTLHHRRRRARLLDDAAAGPQRPDLAGRTEAEIRATASAVLAGAYPDEDQVLPTRLGNALRRYEATVGQQYDLELMTVVPRLAMVAADRDVEYVQNQRVQMELALRTSFLSLLASLVTLVLLWRHGWWLLIALIPYAVGYLAYRGAVAVAHEYGTALAVLVDLNRFALYDRLRVKPPADIDDERDLNTQLMLLFRTEPNTEAVRYDPAPPPAPVVVVTQSGEEDG